MKNLKEEYSNLITALSPDNFKFFVKHYLMDYWKTNEVNITDGPWDGGIDASLVKDNVEKKINIQITVQDNYEKKLLDDLKKSKENVENYNYQNKLDFFISKPISKSKKNELIQNAEVDFDISLRIYDSNKLGDDTNTFARAKQVIHEIYAENTLKTELSVDKKTKVLYDIFSTGSNVADIKYDFINSHIQLYLFDKKAATLDEILNYINSTLNTNLHKKSIHSQILKQQKQGLVDEIDCNFQLTDFAKEKIVEVKTLSNNQENLLIDSVGDCLRKYDLEKITIDIILKIQELYNAHYDAEIEELHSRTDSFEPKERKIFYELSKYVKEKGVDKQQINSLIKEILTICARNEYLHKISISNLFTSLFKSDSLDKYLEQFNRKVFLDTQVLLQMICYEHNDTNYDDNLYGAVKYLCQQKENLDGKIQFYTTTDYVEEVAGHLWEANKIKRLMELPYIESLGRSKNVFFNYYRFLRDNSIEILEDFDEFIERVFDLELNAVDKRDFVNDVYGHIRELLEGVNIEIVEVPYYEKFPSYKKEYENELSYIGHDHKSKRARDNDLKCLLYLSTEDLHIDENTGLFDEPFLITWDSSFYQMRKLFTKKYRDFSYWYIYTPMKFANRLSVMRLKLDTSAMNYNIISLAETNFNLSNESLSFVDTLSAFFNKGNMRDWQLGKKLAKLKKAQKEDSNLSEFTDKHHDNQPIDEVLRAIQNYYNSPSVETSFKSVVELFEKDENSDTLADLILKSCETLKSIKSVDNKLFEEIDKMINAR
ncbi:MAG: hypothetical protein PHY08_14310 [Candidatus Cloacimonetes bacterium]|nr:hypothetical protein [Candidatus Cloacimonadota bacterium]